MFMTEGNRETSQKDKRVSQRDRRRLKECGVCPERQVKRCAKEVGEIEPIVADRASKVRLRILKIKVIGNLEESCVGGVAGARVFLERFKNNGEEEL